MVVLKGLLQGQMVNDAGKLVVIEELIPSRLLAPAFCSLLDMSCLSIS